MYIKIIYIYICKYNLKIYEKHTKLKNAIIYVFIYSERNKYSYNRSVFPYFYHKNI